MHRTMTGVRVESWAQFILLGTEAGRKIQVGHRFEKGTFWVCKNKLVCKSGSRVQAEMTVTERSQW